MVVPCRTRKYPGIFIDPLSTSSFCSFTSPFLYFFLVTTSPPHPLPLYLSPPFPLPTPPYSLLILSQGQWQLSSKLNGNIEWVKYTDNSSSLFASFEERVELDGEVRTMQVGASIANMSISFALPHFWSIAVIDPSMYSPHSPLSPLFPLSFPPLMYYADYSVLLNSHDTNTTTHKVQHKNYGVS